MPKIAREIALAPETLRSWVHTVQVDADEREGLTTEERVRSCAGLGAR